MSPIDYRAILNTGIRARFEQDPELKNRFLSSGTSTLAVASPKDAIWGIGMDAATADSIPQMLWKGQNRPGKILMELRSEFAAEGKTE